MKKMKYPALLGAIAIACGGLAPSATARSGDIGGWEEGRGTYSVQVGQGPSITGEPEAQAARRISQPRHWGKAEYKVIRGTTHKRARGWTVWPRVWHYTRARLMHYWPHKGVIADSGRQWGYGGTTAVTKWVAFNPSAPSDGFGRARTNYGR